MPGRTGSGHRWRVSDTGAGLAAEELERVFRAVLPGTRAAAPLQRLGYRADHRPQHRPRARRRGHRIVGRAGPRRHLRAHPVGCQKSACSVTCGDGQSQSPPVVRHHDHPCPCACSTSSSSGSAAGWFFSAGHRPPRTRSCSCCGMRSPCCAAPIPGPARLGRPRGARRTHPAPASEAAGAPAGHPWQRLAVASPFGRPQVDLPEPGGTASGQHRDRRADRAARDREPRLGIPADPR